MEFNTNAVTAKRPYNAVAVFIGKVVYGISYFDAEDGKKLAVDIPDVFAMPGGKEKYWEQVPLVYRRNHYKVYIRECFENDIVEIDTFNELKQIDHAYDC